MKQPDKETLKLWMQGELAEPMLDTVEQWADENPALAASLIGELEISPSLLDCLPAEVEPPHADFLNVKIQRQIEMEQQLGQSEQGTRPTWLERFKWLLVPVGALAMALCFMLGTQYGDGGVANLPQPQDSVSYQIYVPNESVKVEVIDNEESSMIVLDGLDPISDDDLSMVSYEAPALGDSVKLISAKERVKEWH